MAFTTETSAAIEAKVPRLIPFLPTRTACTCRRSARHAGRRPSENRYGRRLAPESPIRQPAGMPAEPRLSVFLFGPPRIERDGKPVEPDTRKAIALLAYLAVTAHPEGRERLAALLWPDANEEHARGALRRTLSALRSALRGAHVTTDGMRA